MPPTTPVANHVANLLVQSTLSRLNEDLPSSPISEEDTQFIGQDEKKEDVEKAEISSLQEPRKQGGTQFFLWIVVNTLATIGIVSSFD